MDPVTIAIAGSAAGGTTSFLGARSQNRAIEASMASVRRNEAVTTQQIQEQAALEQRKRADEAAQLEGRIRVATAERGIGSGGSVALLQRQNRQIAAVDARIISQNAANQLLALRTGSQAQIDQLQASAPNELLTAFSGVLQGATTGLNIANSLLTFEQLQAQQQGDITS